MATAVLVVLGTAGAAGMHAAARRGLIVRVASRNGAPRLEVNGKPVRARMFFGGSASGSIRVGPNARRIEFEFTATSSAPGDGTMHFRFGNAPGHVYLDEIHVADVGSGAGLMPRCTFDAGAGDFERDWHVWPPGERNTVGRTSVENGAGLSGSPALHVTIRTPPGGEWPDFHIYHAPTLNIVEGRRYRVSFWCRAEPARDLFVAFYRPGRTFVHLGGPPGPFETQIRLAAGAGADFVSFPLPTPWQKPGEAADWSAVDAECEKVLRASPNALLLPRLGLDPPGWWAEEHPDEMMVWENGSRGRTAVPSSPIYRRDACAALTALVRHVEARFGDHVAGYHPCGQNTGEWFYEETWGGLLNGYARADAAAFREWLGRRYRSDAELQSAWHMLDVTRAGAVVPSAAERRSSPNGVLRNPGAERRLVDFALFQQDGMADLVCDLARAVRQATAGRKLVVFFYGYSYEFGGVVLGPATCGHYAMRRVLECPDIDVLCSPISYGDRGLAQTGPVMSAAESVALTGTKMWLQEDDTRTHVSPDTSDAIARLKTPWETEMVLTRNVANEATRNLATWWMDLGMTGWFNDARIWRLMSRLKPLDEVFLNRAIPYKPEVASVMDERSMSLVGPFVHGITGPIIYSARHHLGRLGAPYGQYLMDDVLAGRVRARMYVFHNAWWLDGEQRRALISRTRGAARVWCYAPGAYESAGPSPDGMREITGFNLGRVAPGEAWATPTDLGRRMGLRDGFGLHERVTPLFAATDARPDEILAVYPDGSAAAALRKTGDGWSLFIGPPAMTPELLRIAARAAGVHLYAEDNSCIWANGPVVAVQSVADKTVTMRLREASIVRDLLSGATVGRGARMQLPMRRGEVRVLRVTPITHKR